MAAKTVIEGSTVSASQLKDFFRQIDEGSLTGPHLQAFIEHRNPFEPKFVSVFYPATLIAKGWTIESDRENLPADWNPKSVKIISPLKKGGSVITGEESIKRLSKEPLLGARGFWHYWNNQADIPEEWKGKYVFFDALVLRNPSGNRYSLSLYWDYGRWHWRDYWLDSVRGSCDVSALSAG